MRLLSLFSGIGAFEKALTNKGVDYELVGFSEIDKWAIESYCVIHRVGKDLNLGDVSKIKNEDLPSDIDMITYGFPCQDISIAGNQEGIKEGTRSGLLYEAERIIEYTKPKYAIAENVKNLVGKRHREDFDKLLKRLDSYGYNNYWKVLNAKDYGVPQNRERVFIVSIRKDVDEGNFSFCKSQSETVDIKNILLDSFDDKYITDVNTDSLLADMAAKGKLEHKGIFEYRRDEGARVFLEGAVGTLRTIDAGGDKRVLVRQGIEGTKQYKIRKLTPLECWRLMGFEDEDYLQAKKRLESVFYNGNDRSDSQMYKQAGNSVVVDVLENVFKQLLSIK